MSVQLSIWSDKTRSRPRSIADLRLMLYISAAALAYGKKGTSGIPGNATLTFDVKLVSVGK